MTEFFLFAAIGIFSGASAGLLGLGGGIITVPALLIVFQYLGVPANQIMHLAISTSLMAIVITSISSIWAHHHAENIDWQFVRKFVFGLVSGGFLGAYLGLLISSDLLKQLFAIYALLMSARLWLPITVKGVSSKLLASPFLFVAGLSFGSLSALVGIGGGTMVVPYLVMAKQPVLRAIGTSSACGFPIAVAGVIGYFVFSESVDNTAWLTGVIHWQALIGVVSTSIIAAHLAAKGAAKMPIAILRRVFSLVLMLVALNLFLN